MKAILTGATVILLAAGVFASTTNTGENMTAAVSGTKQSTQTCIDAVNERDGNTLTDDAYEAQYQRINSDKKKDIVLKNTTDEFCGSAGCVYEICLQKSGEVELIPFSYAAQKLTVLDSLTGNMHDIELQGKSSVHLVWDHSRYIHTR